MQQTEWLNQMQQTEWLNQLEKTLLKAGLPAHYVSRTSAELADHAEESSRAGKQRNLFQECPTDLATTIVRSYRSRGVFRRIPPILLLLLPLPITVLLTLAYFGACYVVLERIFDCFDGTGGLSLQVTMTMWTLFYLGKFAGPFLSILMVREIAKRMARPWYWAAILFGIHCLAVAATRSELILVSNDSSLSIDCGLEYMLEVTQLISAAAIAAVGFVIVLQQRGEQQRVFAADA